MWSSELFRHLEVRVKRASKGDGPSVSAASFEARVTAGISGRRKKINPTSSGARYLLASGRGLPKAAQRLPWQPFSAKVVLCLLEIL